MDYKLVSNNRIVKCTFTEGEFTYEVGYEFDSLSVVTKMNCAVNQTVETVLKYIGNISIADNNGYVMYNLNPEADVAVHVTAFASIQAKIKEYVAEQNTSTDTPTSTATTAK